MLNYIVLMLNYLKQIMYFALVASYKVGQLIIFILSNVLELLNNFYKYTGVVLKIMLEDFHIFVGDVGQHIASLASVVETVFENIFHSLQITGMNCKYGVACLLDLVVMPCTAIINGLYKISLMLGQLCTSIKYFIIMLGAGVWFAITLIPLFIYYTCTMFIYYTCCLIEDAITIINSGINEIQHSAKKLYDFMTDVPIESIAGLIGGACILYVFVKFYVALHRFLYEHFVIVLTLARTRLENFRLFETDTVQFEVEPNHESSEDEGQLQRDSPSRSDYQYCIVCQERTKCILILPCRHVCLCEVCNITLRNYNRQCPICRTSVKRTMKVFV